jgi:anti-sigma B factor antagonist
MSLEIKTGEREGIAIVQLDGQLTFGNEDLDFRNELDRLTAAGRNRVILNLTNLRQVDKTGMSTLLSARTRLREAGGNLALSIVKPSHIGLVTEAHLEAVFEVFHDEQDAINSFFPDREIKSYDVLDLVKSHRYDLSGS